MAPFYATMRRRSPAWDLFVVPAIDFGLLYALIIVRLDQRKVVWVNFDVPPGG